MFGKAQPALLYLSPACIVSFGATAALRGELGTAWGWSDEEAETDAPAHEEDAGDATSGDSGEPK